MRVLAVISAAALSFLTTAAVALAGGPTRAGYDSGGGTVQGEVQRGAGGGGSLPLTGLDLGLLVGGGIVLLLVGGSVWRLSRENA